MRAANWVVLFAIFVGVCVGGCARQRTQTVIEKTAITSISAAKTSVEKIGVSANAAADAIAAATTTNQAGDRNSTAANLNAARSNVEVIRQEVPKATAALNKATQRVEKLGAVAAQPPRPVVPWPWYLAALCVLIGGIAFGLKFGNVHLAELGVIIGGGALLAFWLLNHLWVVLVGVGAASTVYYFVTQRHKIEAILDKLFTKKTHR